MYLQTCGSLGSANRKKAWVRKSGSHLRKVRKSNKLFLKVRKFADLLFAEVMLCICGTPSFEYDVLYV